MQHHRQWLRGLRGEHQVGAIDQIVAIGHARRKLAADELAKAYGLTVCASEGGEGR